MLKRLFISFLILSALTSDGAAAQIIQYNVVNSLDAGILGVYGSESLNTGMAQSRTETGLTDGPGYSLNAVVPLEDILQSHAAGDKTCCSFSGCAFGYRDISAYNSTSETPDSYLRDEAISCSDSSPPFYGHTL